LRAYELFEYNLPNLISIFKKKVDNKLSSDQTTNASNLEQLIQQIETPLKKENKMQIIDPYMKWIITQYANNKINYAEDIFSKTIPELLTYDALKRKKKLAPEETDIGRIKSLGQLMDITDRYKEVDTTSNSEKEKSIEQQMYDTGEATLVYNGPQIKVVIPHTEKASCYFGKNTRWCTAATKGENYFDSYNKKGPLYIVLIKPTNERYQFHFQDKAFMNEKDEQINLLNLANKYPKLWDIFTPIADKNQSVILNKNPSEKLQKFAVRQSGVAIRWIENPSEEVQKLAVQETGWALEYIKNPSEEVQKLAVQQTGLTIKFIENPSEEVQKLAVQQTGHAIQYIENPSEEVQKLAVQQTGWALEYINNPSEEVQKLAVQHDGRAIKFIENPSKEIRKLAKY